MRGRLEHWHFDTFELDFERRWQGDTLVTFDLGPGGSPARFEAMGLTWERVPNEE